MGVGKYTSRSKRPARRKAGSIANPELLGNWLYGVAVRVARRARRAAARRRKREVLVTTMPEPSVPAAEPDPDIVTAYNLAVEAALQGIRRAGGA